MKSETVHPKVTTAGPDHGSLGPEAQETAGPSYSLMDDPALTRRQQETDGPAYTSTETEAHIKPL